MMHLSQPKNQEVNNIGRILVVFMLFLTAGCANRESMSVNEEDATITYAGKKSDDLTARITLYRFEDDCTGTKIGKGTRFYLEDGEYVRAHVELRKLFQKSQHSQMFHLEWIDQEGQSFYMKRENLHPEDSLTFIYSSISADTDREPGKYGIKIYHFRELIAEKSFELIPDSMEKPGAVEGITGTITLCSKVNRKTGKRLGIDTVFAVGKRNYVRAFVDLENRFVNNNLVLDFDIEWIGPDNQAVYTKDVVLKPDDPDAFLYSSISIPSGKREPGEYLFRVKLFDRLLVEKAFLLK